MHKKYEGFTSTGIGRTGANGIEESHLRDLHGLASFLCAEQIGTVPLLLEMVRESYPKICPVRAPYKLQALRRQLITAAISVFRDEIDFLFYFYRNPVELHIQTRLHVGSNGLVYDKVCLHHRMLMLMVFRENYAVRDCALLLSIDEDLVREACDEALTILAPSVVC